MQNIKTRFNEIVLAESKEIHSNADLKFDYVEVVFVVLGIIGVLV